MALEGSVLVFEESGNVYTDVSLFFYTSSGADIKVVIRFTNGRRFTITYGDNPYYRGEMDRVVVVRRDHNNVENTMLEIVNSPADIMVIPEPPAEFYLGI